MPQLDLSYTAYVWVKAVHVIAVVTWLICICMLLFGRSLTEITPVLRRFFIISHSALLSGVITGGILLLNFANFTEGWLHAKLTLAVILGVLHLHLCQRLSQDKDKKVFLSPVLTSLPMFLFIAIVICVMVRP